MPALALGRLLPLLALAAATAIAQPPATVFLDDLTSPELAARIAAGSTTILVPVGGTEQNGAHMTLGKHNVRARLLAERIARELGNALVAPVIAYVPEGSVAPPTAHMRYPGTITVPEAAFEAMLAEAGRSFKLHGFRDIVFLADHGDYRRNLATVATRLNHEWAKTPVRAHAVNEYYETSQPGFAKALAARGYSVAEIGAHAGLADTSLMLALDPSQVRADAMKAPPSPGKGVSGDPRRASAELGQVAVDAIVAQTVAAIRVATQRK